MADLKDGQIRIRVGALQDGFPATGNEAVLEYYHAGDWHRLRGLTMADIRIRRDDIVTARLGVELAGVDITAWPVALRDAFEAAKLADGRACES